MRSAIENSVVILGAGIAGISAAYHLRKAGISAAVYEANATAGGLLDNFCIEGFRFDNAVHLSFATEPEVRAVFDRTPYLTHPAVSWCWDDGLWLKHPVQNNMFPIEVAQRVELISGFVARPNIEVKNYRDWLNYQDGEAIASRWSLPYTEKYWTVPAEQLGIGWIGDRVRRADLQEVLYGAFTSETPSYYYVSEMRYPCAGGYRAFIEPMIAEVDIHCQHRVTGISLSRRHVYFDNDRSTGFDVLINTLPLPELIALIDEVPEQVRTAAGTLFATSVDLISVGFRKADVQPNLWFYIYDNDILAARAYSPSIKSPENVPAGCSSLQFEIYSSQRKPQTHTPEEMKRNTMMGLQKMGMVKDEDDVLFMHHKKLEWGNVVFDLGMEERRAIVRDWLETVGILTAGRFGEWDYLWSNQAFMSGLRAAEAVKLRGVGQ
ncbi:MAG: FAD-dependent oxidoreductase [Gallionella sp.]|nr:FAD-dependent oxidoreductase [Gallionella sp.]